ncbi:hypothetical protein V5799_003355 [Amblyomma americanum]|uniref:Uncharacterized protein n=1 Tax=Amblyomma americanum TaxID=6943 RepID=A0AAQ4D979_AMBAM
MMSLAIFPRDNNDSQGRVQTRFVHIYNRYSVQGMMVMQITLFTNHSAVLCQLTYRRADRDLNNFKLSASHVTLLIRIAIQWPASRPHHRLTSSPWMMPVAFYARALFLRDSLVPRNSQKRITSITMVWP